MPSPIKLYNFPKSGHAHRIEHDHRRYVERLRQRIVHRHRAVAEAVEIDRHVAVEGGRPVLDQRLRMGKAELEAQPVDQGLEGRAGRAHRFGHVDEAAGIVVEQAGRAHRGQHLAARLVGDDDRD